jgi:hypothetical protein
LLSPVREYFSFFSSRAMKQWIVASVICSAFFLLWIQGGVLGSITAVFSIALPIGMQFVFGIPFVIGASLLFTSQETHYSIIKQMASNKRFRFFSLFIIFSALTMLLMIIPVTVGYAIEYSSIIDKIEFLTILPPSLLLLSVISLLLCPFYVLLSILLDDLKLTLLLGTLLSCSFASATGLPMFPVQYPEVAFLHPSHILSALLFIIVGGFTNPYCVECYVGLIFTPSQLIMPIGILCIASVLCYWGAHKVFFNNISRWSLEVKDYNLEEYSNLNPLSENEKGKLRNLTKDLDSRRRAVIAVSVLIILIVPIFGSSYVSTRDNEWTEVVYSSPDEGEFIAIGSETVDLSIGCEGEILSWVGGSGYIRLNFDIDQMTTSEFQSLNDTQLEDLFGSSISGVRGTTGHFGTGWRGPIWNEDYIWVLRFLNINGKTSGTIHVRYSVIIKVV